MLSKNCFGFCQKCQKIHEIKQNEAYEAALSLLTQLEQYRCLDFEQKERQPQFSTDYLFGKALGQMFGVLTGINSQGEKVILKAFSCQYNGIWDVPGWESPLFNVDDYLGLVEPADLQIKAIEKQLVEDKNLTFTLKENLKLRRKQISQKLMIDLHQLYQLHNFKGEVSTLSEVFYAQTKGIPTGCGDCCAPKLLNAAAIKGIVPTGLSEFYFGLPNRSGTKKNREFYPSCQDKCQPILGFLLCGL